MLVTSQPTSAAQNLVQKLLYSRKEAAYALSISCRSLDLLIASGQLAVRKIGSRIMIPAHTLHEYAATDHDTLTDTVGVTQ